jgi:hypothetical protein
MPRAANAKLYLNISPASLAAACEIAPRHVYAAIDAGHLTVKTLAGTMARRIAVGPETTRGTAAWWFKNIWQAKPTTKPRRKIVQDHPDEADNDENI